MTLPLNSRLSALYDTNGTQKDFGFGFRVFFDPDNGGYGLEVRRQTADGYEVIPKSDYLVLPVEDNSAGVVRFSVAPSVGQQIYIAGKTPTIQQLVLTNFGRYSAESIETQFDFITAIIQEWLSALGEETRQRIAADDILTQYVVQRIDAFVQQVNQNFDDKSQEIEDYIDTIMPSFTQTLRDEIEAYAVAGMQDAIDQTLAESNAEIYDAVARANAAATAAAITGKVYDTPEAGVNPVTGVADGAYYNVRSTDDDSFLIEYQNVGGVPTPSGKSYPSSAALTNIQHNNLKNRDAAGAHPASAISYGDGSVGDFLDEQQQFNNSVTPRVASVLILRDSPVKTPAIRLESYIEGLYKGGQDLYWDNTSTAMDDGVSCFAVTGVTTGRWKSVNLGLLTAYHAGALGDDVTDDTAALQRYATFCRTKQVPMDLEYGKWAISSTIQCGTVYGISNKGGSIRMLASVDGFIINGVSRGALLEKFTFKSDVANVNDKATIVFDITTGHIFGMIFSGYTFNNTGNTWVGIDVKSSTNSIYGLFGGTSFMNLQTLRLKHAMRFSDGPHFINSVIFKNSFHSYDTLPYKVDKTLVGCVFDHVYGQECVTAIAQLLKAAERTAFSNMHNWDTLQPTIIINDSCNNLEFKNILLNEIRGFGYKCVYPETYQLKNLASATSVDIWTRFYHSTKADFMRLFNAEELVGTATITDGRYHPNVQTWSAGLNPAGVMFSTNAANDVANLTYYSKTNTLANTRVALLERYVTATFSYQFKLTSIDLDNYSFFVGVQGYNSLTTGNFYGYAVGVTNIAGNLVLVKRAISNSATAAYNATDLTVISVLGALSVSTVEIGMRINTDTGNIGAVWYNGTLLTGADLSGLALQNKTPIVHVKQVSAKPVNLFLKNAYLQVHSNQQ